VTGSVCANLLKSMIVQVPKTPKAH
jgi:hypothetical protein